MSKIFLLLLGITLTGSLSAQHSGYFRLYKIDSIMGQAGKTYVHIPFGTRHGVNPEATPIIYSVYSDEIHGRDGMYSLGTITNCSDLHTWIEPLLILHEEVTLQKGDLVGVQTMMKTAAWEENPLFQIALRNIGLMDVYNSLYHPQTYYFQHSDEESYLKDISVMIQDVQFTGGAMREQMEDIPVDSGRYANRMLFDVMEEVTREDLELFFEYIIAKPDIYQGFAWKLSEAFATWVVSGAPEVKKEEPEPTD